MNQDNITRDSVLSKRVWEKVLSARDGKRINSLGIMHHVFRDMFELHGDRYYGDDHAVIGGVAYLSDMPVTVIGQYKGSNYEDRKNRQYGMPLPEGYRKALRLMKQAEKFNRPIICFIDTPGAYPGMNAEERGQAEAIARNLFEMSALTVPVISVVVSEGGSGGALALGIANKVYMLENAIYSVVSPEGCASILWKDVQKAPEASEYLRLTADCIYSMGIIDNVIDEKGTEGEIYIGIRDMLYQELCKLKKMSRHELREQRKKKFRNIGTILNITENS